MEVGPMTRIVKQIVVDYFKNLYTDEPCPGANDLLPWDQFQEFNNRDWEWLTRYFHEPEIESVVAHMGALKAPGPDGFQALFYQKNWNLIESSLCEIVTPVFLNISLYYFIFNPIFL
ncbi:hypothetical protein RND81_10G130700 [Saponaria officinalis]|uniref:Reverse transcriptase n=1 Tax=Saponaria officinalis TaxID=3572 RepID=A0AAW1I3X8_SAPOF